MDQARLPHDADELGHISDRPSNRPARNLQQMSTIAVSQVDLIGFLDD